MLASNQDDLLVELLLLLFVSFLGIGGPVEERNIASLPIVDDRHADISDHRLATLLQLTGLLGDLGDEILSIFPMMNSEDVRDMLLVNLVQNGLDVVLGIWESFGSHHSLEDFISVSLTLIIDDTWTVNQVDALGERDVLPVLSFTWDGCDLATGFLHERVDD